MTDTQHLYRYRTTVDFGWQEGGRFIIGSGEIVGSGNIPEDACDVPANPTFEPSERLAPYIDRAWLRRQLQAGRVEAVPRDRKPSTRYVAGMRLLIESTIVEEGVELGRGGTPSELRHQAGTNRKPDFTPAAEYENLVDSGRILARLVDGRCIAEPLANK
jgi:hypothetical protein